MKTTYFIRAGKFLKIGQSSDPQSRASQIATCCPYPCALLKTDDQITEAEAKAVAASLSKRVNGEWFEITPALEQWLATGRLPASKPPIVAIIPRTSQTKIVIDLADELTAEEIADFERSAKAAGAENLTVHFLNLTLRQDTSAA